MVSPLYARHYPAGREFKRDDQPVPTDTTVSDAGDPSSTPSDVPPADGVPTSSDDPTPTLTETDYFVPSSALNNPQPTNIQPLGTDASLPASTLTVFSTQGLPAPSTVTSSTDTLQSTPTAVLALGGISTHRKYIIGGAVGGGVLVLILLALLVFCCRKRRAKRDVEHSGDGHSEGHPGYGQFACCSHGTCNRGKGQPQMGQKTPLKPFVLRSDPEALTPMGGQQPRQQQRPVTPNRRDSTDSQKSAGSDISTGSVYSSDSEGSQRSRRSQKRPPPLKLTSLVTPVINGPQHNPRDRVGRSSLLSEVPMIVVEPPQSMTPDRMRRH